MSEDKDATTNREDPWGTIIYGAVVRAMAEGMVVHDATGAIRTANPSAERILGPSLAQMKGLKAVDPRWRLVLPDGRPATSEDILPKSRNAPVLPVETSLWACIVHRVDSHG